METKYHAEAFNPVILRNEVTKDLMKTRNGEHFKILRLRYAPLRMTNPGFVDSLYGAPTGRAVFLIIRIPAALC